MRLPCDHGITSQSLPWPQCGSMWIYCTHTSPLGQLRATWGLAPLAKGVPGDALHYHSINFCMATRRQPHHGSALCTEGLPLPLEQSAVCSNTCCKRMHQWLRCYKNVKAALAWWGVRLTFRFCSCSTRLSSELPFPKLLPESTLYLLHAIVGSLVKTPSLCGVYPDSDSFSPDLYKLLQSWGGNICPLSPHSAPSLHREAKRGNKKKTK